MRERATEVEAIFGEQRREVLEDWRSGRAQRISDVGIECFGGPYGAGRQQAGQDRLRSEALAAPHASGDNRRGCSAERPDGGGFFGGVAEELLRDSGFDFKDGVDTFDGNVETGVVREQRRGIEVVKNGDIDLTGSMAVGIDDECGGGPVALGKMALEESQPVLLGGGPGCGGMLEHTSYGELGEHLDLDPAEDLGEVDLAGVRFAWHSCDHRLTPGSGKFGAGWAGSD